MFGKFENHCVKRHPDEDEAVWEERLRTGKVHLTAVRQFWAFWHGSSFDEPCEQGT